MAARMTQTAIQTMAARMTQANATEITFSIVLYCHPLLEVIQRTQGTQWEKKKLHNTVFINFRTSLVPQIRRHYRYHS